MELQNIQTTSLKGSKCFCRARIIAGAMNFAPVSRKLSFTVQESVEEEGNYETRRVRTKDKNPY
jgi:hypothetical protein